MKSFDVTIIGAGPGGVAAALESASLGYKTCLVEASRLGGTCLQTGCIPSKTFLHAASLIDDLKSAKNFGIQTGAFSLNVAELIQKKQNVISILEKGIKTQLDKAGVTAISGTAKFVSAKEIKVDGENIQSKNFILATGSRPRELSQFPFDGKGIISSTEGLVPEKIPASLVIIGGGVIGAEFASMYSSFGTKVTIVEILDRIIATEDPEISKRMEVSFKKRGIQIYLNDLIISREKSGMGFKMKLKSGVDIEAEKILVAIGRSRNSAGLGLEEAGVRVEEDGSVSVNQYLETSQPGIFAIGDLLRAPQLAHAASYEGELAVRNIKEKKHVIDLSLIPSAIYTHPEAASVGLTLEKAGASAKEVKALFGSVGRSHTEGVEEGIAKLVFDASSGRLLGAHLFGAHATEFISELTLAIRAKLTLKDLAQTIHPHPTLSEIIQELAKQGG